MRTILAAGIVKRAFPHNPFKSGMSCLLLSPESSILPNAKHPYLMISRLFPIARCKINKEERNKYRKRDGTARTTKGSKKTP
jgi:hypothetical protein